MSRPGWRPKVTEELIDETAWVRERDQMATWQLVDRDMQSFPRDPSLEGDREEAIVSAGDHVDRNFGPRFEAARLSHVCEQQPLPHRGPSGRRWSRPRDFERERRPRSTRFNTQVGRTRTWRARVSGDRRGSTRTSTRFFSTLGFGLVQGHCGSNERLQGLLVDIIALVKIDRAPDVALEARVEEA